MLFCICQTKSSAAGILPLSAVASGLLLACGGLSVGAIAIGDAASGEIVFDIHSDIAPEVIQHAILERFPGTWNIIAKLFSLAVS